MKFLVLSARNNYKKDGYIAVRHILASPRYAPGTIAVNVTWMKR